MSGLLLALIIFAICFIVRLISFIVLRKKIKAGKRENSILLELLYLAKRFGLNIKKLNNIGMASLISFMDGLIISVTFLIVISITDSLILEMLLGFVIMMALIFLSNEILGSILKKKGFDK